jgi:hypothetical protein
MAEQSFSCTLGRKQRIAIMIDGLITAVKLAFLFPSGISDYLLSKWGAGLSSKGYSVGPEGIAIYRHTGRKILIPIHEIAAVEPVESDSLKGYVRTFGVIGFRGNWGHFWSKNLLSFKGYWSNNDSLVLVRRIEDDPVLLSPDNRKDFLSSVNQFLQR